MVKEKSARNRLYMWIKRNEGGIKVYPDAKEYYSTLLGALDKIIRIQEIIEMPIQENAVKYSMICEVINK